MTKNNNTKFSQSYYLLGHRGARAERLENSESGFYYASELNKSFDPTSLDGVEFDIQMSLDGEFVVVHDETLIRLGQNQSWIADKTLAELNAFSQSDYQRYQSDFNPNFLGQKFLALKNMLPYLQHYEHIELEIKTHQKTNPQMLVKNLLTLLADEKWQKLPITLTSFDTEILYQLQNQQSLLSAHLRYPTGLLLEPNATLSSQIAFLPKPNYQGNQLIYNTFNLACALGCTQIGVYYALITPLMVDIAKRFGLSVTAWTVNDVCVAKKLLELGVDCIITDYPAKFLRQLNCE